jgi:hypothetical protein
LETYCVTVVGKAESGESAEIDGGGDSGRSMNDSVFAGEDDLTGSSSCDLHGGSEGEGVKCKCYVVLGVRE